MLVKCNCNQCPAQIEFDSAKAGQVITCPTCGMETTLYVPPVPIAPKPAAPASPPRQQFSTPGAAYQQKFSKNVLPWIIVAVLVVVVGILCSALYSEHRELLNTKLDLVSAKQQLEQSQTDLKSSKVESEKLRASAIDATSRVLAQDDKQLMETVAGIYFFNPQNRQTQKLDLRSDGTAYLSKFSGQYEMRPKKFTWKLDENSVFVLMEDNAGSRLSENHPLDGGFLLVRGRRFVREQGAVKISPFVPWLA